jgi:hypothetical protein
LRAKRKPGSEGKCEGMNPHTPKGASTLGVCDPDGLPNFQRAIIGIKPNGLKKNYIIRKILKHRCLKWAHMTHLDI